MALLAKETRWREGVVSPRFDGAVIAPGASCVSRSGFLLRTESGLDIHYRRGEGVTVARGGGVAAGEEALWLAGSVRAAIAAICGLLPLHASAVAHEGRVYAFAGASGTGKSTLVAALARAGLAVYADDTLLLDLGDPARLVCLPGHKRLKLADDVLALTGARGEEGVGAGIAKRYARPAQGAPPPPRHPLELAAICFIEEGGAVAVKPIGGGEAIARLGEDHYTQRFFTAVAGLDRAGLFALRARIARQARMTCLTRPRALDRLADSVACVVQALRADGALQ